MTAAISGLVLISWQGWSVTSSIAALLILLTTILLWLLPFPSGSVAGQLEDPQARADLEGRFGAATPFNRYQTAMHRLGDWLQQWFGRKWSAQAFERCVAIAFVFPVTLFLLASMLAGYKAGQVSLGAIVLFLIAVTLLSVGVRALFHFCYWFARRRWSSIGGDRELADIIARVVLGAFAVVFAFAIAFAVASSLAGEASSAGTVVFAIVGGFAFALAFAVAFAFAGPWAFLIALVLVAGIALTMAKDFAFYLLLFFVILPVLNAVMDWLSWAVTRINLMLMGLASPSLAGALYIVILLIAGAVAAIGFVIVLTVLLPIGLELADLLLSLFGRKGFDWRDAATQALRAPWSEGLFVTGMLLTPLIPALTVLSIGFAALACPFTPGAGRMTATLAAAQGAPLDDAAFRDILRVVYLSRLWYVPAVILSVALFVVSWLVLYLANAPVAHFLYKLALCSTSWSHGYCSTV